MIALPQSGAPLLGILRGSSHTDIRQQWYLTGFLIYGDGFPGKRDTFSLNYHHIAYQKVTSFSGWINEKIKSKNS